jgi:vacuolar protein sorting-associated protein 45
MQHIPLLVELVDQLVRGRLSQSVYPRVEDRNITNPATALKDVILFIINGSTFVEEAAFERYCMSVSGVRVILGGTFVHNSESMLKEMHRIMEHLQ